MGKVLHDKQKTERQGINCIKAVDANCNVSHKCQITILNLISRAAFLFTLTDVLTHNGSVGNQGEIVLEIYCCKAEIHDSFDALLAPITPCYAI